MNKKIFKTIKWVILSFCILFFLLLSIPFLIPVSKASKLNDVKPFSNSMFTICNGLELHYRIWENEDLKNSKKWILLLHGMGGSTYSWENNAKVFCDSGYNVIAVDIPPYGYSAKNPDFNYSTDNISRLLWKFANRISSNTKWILVGHSMGGGVAQCMAVMKPENVQKVVFVAPAMFSKIEPGRKFSQHIMAFSPVEKFMSVLGEYYFLKPKRIRKMLESSFAAELPDSVANQYFKALNNDGFTISFLRSFSTPNPSETVNGLDFKTESLAFFGTQDTWVPYENMKTLTDKLSSIEILHIEGAGHSLMETHFEEFNFQTLKFIMFNNKPE